MNIEQAAAALADGQDIGAELASDEFAPRMSAGDTVLVSATAAIQPEDITLCFFHGKARFYQASNRPEIPMTAYAITGVSYKERAA